MKDRLDISPPLSRNMRHRFNMVVTAALCLAQLASAGSNYNLPLDRPYTLRNPEPFLLEREYARQIRSDGRMSFIFPRPCSSELDSSSVCGDAHGFHHAGDGDGRKLSISPLAGYEFRHLGEAVNAFDGGLLVTGGNGPISFYMDARMTAETHEDFDHPSFDREFVERQDVETSGSIAYSSFSRYRANLAYDLSWARISIGRDAAHWGPGLLGNLVFHQDAVPFNQVTLTTHLGPLTVQSLYGQLAPHTDWETDTSTAFRSVYAHRYEWRIRPGLLFGVTEQLILHKREAPFAFIPLVPLYIAKAVEKERLNNGNIAGDIAWRMQGVGIVYSEFLIDDIQSPTSLFDDQWGNKWAWMAGLHLVRELRGWTAGAIAEYARLEPWVYTHYLPETAQAAHLDHPLGNQRGPNSQTATTKAYIRNPSWYLGMSLEGVWKGTDRGSSVLDIHSEDQRTKVFLGPPVKRGFAVTPTASYYKAPVSVHLQARLGNGPEGRAGVQWQY